MRWNSVGGTRPAKIKDSVPRLSAPHVERTRISRGPGEVTFSVRNSTRLGPLYQSACPISSPTLLARNWIHENATRHSGVHHASRLLTRVFGRRRKRVQTPLDHTHVIATTELRPTVSYSRSCAPTTRPWRSSPGPPAAACAFAEAFWQTPWWI